MLCVCLGLPTAFAATITPSVTQISLYSVVTMI